MPTRSYCAGQVSGWDHSKICGKSLVGNCVIGGADYAGELDAVRAIRQGVELAIAVPMIKTSYWDRCLNKALSRGWGLCV